MITTQQLATRSIQLRTDTSNRGARTVEAVLSTENPVAVFDYREGAIIEECLLASGVEVDDQIPLQLDHERSIPAMVGSGRDIRQAGSEIVATLHFATGTEAADDAWSLVSQGHARDVSVGYRVVEATELKPGETATVAGRSFTAPAHRRLRIVTQWRLKEVSLVTIGADESAKIRGDHHHHTRSNESNSMIQTLSQTIGHRNVSGMTFAQLAKATLQQRGERALDNDRDTCRAAFSGVNGISDLAGVVNMAILDGYRGATDSLAGCYSAQDTPNYLAQQFASMTTLPRLELVGRGGTAPSIAFTLDNVGGYRLARFGLQFDIDEQDVEDGHPLHVYQLALREIGGQVRRMISDLLWSVLLSNPEMTADSTAVFHTDHGNVATGGPSALALASLDTGMGAIGAQTGIDEDGDPIHLGLSGRYLVVPPAIEGAARRLVRNMATGTGDLIVRPESRLTDAGVVDPTADVVLEGNNTNWLLAAPADQATGLVLGVLNGQMEPDIRSYELTGGQFGVGFDVQFSCAAAVVDPKPLYWSAGQ